MSPLTWSAGKGAIHTPAGGQKTMLRGLILIDTAIDPGTSGGKLLDRSRRVIGVDTAIFSGRRCPPSL